MNGASPLETNIAAGNGHELALAMKPQCYPVCLNEMGGI